MRIVNSAWTPQINLLLLMCECGHFFWVRSDRWWPTCPSCGMKEHLHVIRERYVQDRR